MFVRIRHVILFLLLAKYFFIDGSLRLSGSHEAFFHFDIEPLREYSRQLEAPQTSSLYSPNYLTANQYISNKCYKVTFTSTGNVIATVIQTGVEFWASGTSAAGGRLVMQDDGNLVIYSSSGIPVWSSHTPNQGSPPYRLDIQGDRNIVLYDATDTPLWASVTTTTAICAEPSCGQVLMNTDQTGGTHTVQFPNGVSASSVADCCNKCNTDPTCIAYVWATNGSNMCWPMSSFSGKITSNNRQLGILPAEPSCGQVLMNTDQTGGTHTVQFPNGVSASSVADCCNKCNTDSTCIAYVWATDGSNMCWPMSSFSGKITSNNRQLGILSGGPSCGQVLMNTDQTGGTHTVQFPNGVSASSVADCCNKCNTDPTCIAYVWATDGSNMCWPMSSFSGKITSNNRQLGIVPAAPPTTYLYSPNYLTTNQYISNECFKVTFTSSGNVIATVIQTGVQFWSSRTNAVGGRLVMQGDGNLVIYSSSGSAVWASNTQNRGSPPYRLVIQSDRNIVVYDTTATPLWATGTNTAAGCTACSTNCAACSSSLVCTSCKSGYYLYQSTCYSSCPSRTVASGSACSGSTSSSTLTKGYKVIIAAVVSSAMLLVCVAGGGYLFYKKYRKTSHQQESGLRTVPVCQQSDALPDCEHTPPKKKVNDIPANSSHLLFDEKPSAPDAESHPQKVREMPINHSLHLFDEKPSAPGAEFHPQKDEPACVICLERTRNILLLPCKHICLCKECFNKTKIALCPVCRSAVESKIDVYF